MQCGGPLGRACAQCGRELPAEANFCSGCGSAVAAPAGPSVAPAPAGAGPRAFASGRYEVRHLLGEGANKRVYLARDSVIDREVAIGVVKTHGLDETGVRRVRREAQAMGRLGDHHNVVSVYDVGQEGKDLYIVAQYMAGGDVQTLLQRSESHRLPVAEALRIALDVCAGLDHAHERGVVHRDIKPGNVWLDADEAARLGDFGPHAHHPGGHHGGNRRLHGARAGRGRRGHGALRPLRPGRDALRDAGGAAATPWP
jgi:hypothetical protein